MTLSAPEPAGVARSWTFLTNHAHVLLVIARDPTARLRDVAETVGVTERAVHGIVADLETAGYLRRTRVGRRNHYTVNPAGHFRHPAEADRRIGDFLALFGVDATVDEGSDWSGQDEVTEGSAR
ncbi:MAG TPA: MarR family winged helix-turn-helix transcriptional regulator [Micromonospora sp.]